MQKQDREGSSPATTGLGRYSWGGIKNMPASLTFVEGGEQRHIHVNQVDVHTQVCGDNAETSLTMTFLNPVARVIEGSLEVPLPEGAAVCGYAMDINGHMVEAIPVEKEEARVAFEQEVRAGRSAGLVEDVKGNCFNLRVYPIPASGTKTVRVRYAWKLPAAGDDDDSNTLLVIPLQFQGTVTKFQLKIDVVNVSQPPSLDTDVSDPAVAGHINFAANGQSNFVTEYHAANVELSRPLFLLVPSFVEKKQQVVVEKRNDLVNASEDHFFQVTDFPEIKGQTDRAERSSATIGVIWDCSYSRHGQDLSRELSLLESILSLESDKCSGQVAVDVFLLRNRLEESQSFVISKGDAATGVLNYLKDQKYDGGTNTTAITAPRKRKNGEELYDYFLLFSDGQGNLGETLPSTLEAPVYAFSNAPKANSTLLKYIASKSGGNYHNLVETKSNETVIATVGQSAFSFVSATWPDGALAEVFPAQPQPIHGFEGCKGRFVICGKLKHKEAVLTLNYGFGTTITDSVTVKLSQENVGPTAGIIARQWAQKKVEALSVFVEKNKKEINAIGRNFGFVTPGTSLLILQDLSTYQKYGIIPPLTLPALRDQYLKAEQDKEKAKQEKRKTKLAKVAAWWAERTEWYKKEFSIPAPGGFKCEENEISSSTNASILSDLTMSSLDLCAAPLLQASPLRREAEVEERARPAAALQTVERGRVSSNMSSRSRISTRSSQAATLSPSPVSHSAAPPPSLSAVGAPPPPPAAGGSAGGGGGGPSPSPASSSSLSSAAAIQLKAWDPQTPYLTAMKSDEGRAYEIYLEQRMAYSQSPAFYLDCSEFFFQRNLKAYGLRVLTTLLEIGIDDPQLYRIVGYKLDQHGEIDQAIDMFEKVLTLRPSEPQSHRDLALVVAKRQNYQRALELLNEVVLGDWDSRFDEIEVTALVEANRIIEFAKAEKIPIVNPIDSQFIQPFDLDLRISMAWDTNDTDIDLHVIEPTDEEAYFGHKFTQIGGYVSRDFRWGYGPEEYMLKKAMEGVYKVRARYYTSHAQSLTGGTTVLLSIFTNYGRPGREGVQFTTIRLQESTNICDVGEVTFTAA